MTASGGSTTWYRPRIATRATAGSGARIEKDRAATRRGDRVSSRHDGRRGVSTWGRLAGPAPLLTIVSNRAASCAIGTCACRAQRRSAGLDGEMPADERKHARLCAERAASARLGQCVSGHGRRSTWREQRYA